MMKPSPRTENVARAQGFRGTVAVMVAVTLVVAVVVAVAAAVAVVVVVVVVVVVAVAVVVVVDVVDVVVVVVVANVVVVVDVDVVVVIFVDDVVASAGGTVLRALVPQTPGTFSNARNDRSYSVAELSVSESAGNNFSTQTSFSALYWNARHAAEPAHSRRQSSIAVTPLSRSSGPPLMTPTPIAENVGPPQAWVGRWVSGGKVALVAFGGQTPGTLLNTRNDCSYSVAELSVAASARIDFRAQTPFSALCWNARHAAEATHSSLHSVVVFAALDCASVPPLRKPAPRAENVARVQRGLGDVGVPVVVAAAAVDVGASVGAVIGSAVVVVAVNRVANMVAAVVVVVAMTIVGVVNGAAGDVVVVVVAVAGSVVDAAVSVRPMPLVSVTGTAVAVVVMQLHITGHASRTMLLNGDRHSSWS